MLLMLLLLLLPFNRAEAQLFSCPPRSWAVPGGGGTMCQCPDGTYASISGCKATFPTPSTIAPQPPAPSWPPQQYQAPATGIESNAIVKAFEDLGSATAQTDKHVPATGTLSDNLPTNPAPPPNQAAQSAIAEMLGQSGPAMPEAKPPFTLPDYKPQPPAPPPPRSTCSDYRDPNCFVTLKPSK